MMPAKKRRLRRAATSCLVLLVLSLFWNEIPFLNAFERSTLDYRYRHFRGPDNPSDRVIFVDLDEETVKAFTPVYGRLPWPRRVYKSVVEFLNQGEPTAILFDVLFTERQVGSDDDQNLAEVSTQNPGVSHAVNFIAESGLAETKHAPLNTAQLERFVIKWREPADFPSLKFDGFELPNDVLLAKTPRVHVVNVDQDKDGLIRRVPLLFNYDGLWLPSLSLAAITSTLKEPNVLFDRDELIVFDKDEKKFALPVDRHGLMPVHYYREDCWFKQEIRLSAILESTLALERGEVEDPSKLTVNPFEFKDKVVIIGSSAIGSMDLKATPLGKHYPGPLVHAAAVSNALNNDHLWHIPGWATYVITLLLLACVYAVVFFFESIILKALCLVPLCGLYIFAALFLFRYHSIALDMVPLALGLIGLVDAFAYLGFVEGRDRKQMTATLSKYLSPELSRQLAESGVNPTAEVGKRKELSIMFSDIRGFTTLSEKTAPENVVSILNEYLGTMTDVIFEHGGTLDKFIGDAIMAFWGAPLDDQDHSLHAVRTAFKMIGALEKLNEKWHSNGISHLHIGIGINTGEVIVGNIGSEKRIDYTVIGDNVNLASRIEGLTKQYGVQCLIGGNTHVEIEKQIICRPVDIVQVKGKTLAEKIVEPLCEKGSANEPSHADLANRFADAWELYYAGNFAKALESFTKLDEFTKGHDQPTKVYLGRCRHLIDNPPHSWTGVYVATSK